MDDDNSNDEDQDDGNENSGEKDNEEECNSGKDDDENNGSKDSDKSNSSEDDGGKNNNSSENDDGVEIALCLCDCAMAVPHLFISLFPSSSFLLLYLMTSGLCLIEHIHIYHGHHS